MRCVNAALAGVLLVNLAGTAAAQEQEQEALPLYEVEVVIFRHLRPLLASEQWPAQITAPALEGALDLSAGQQPRPDDVAPIEPRRLAGQVAKLAKMSNFKLLLHTAWRQPGFENDAAIAIRLHAGPLDAPLRQHRPAPVPQAMLPVGTALQSEEERPFSQGWSLPGRSGASSPGDAQTTGSDVDSASALVTHTLDGTLTLIRSRFLHVYTDLVYTVASDFAPTSIRRQQAAAAMDTLFDPAAASGALQPSSQDLPMQSYPLRYHRRMRSKEVHYLDHPLLGVLILATPVEADASELTE